MSQRLFEKITLLLGILFLSKLSWTGELSLMIHPRYFWLVYGSIGVLALVFFFGKHCGRLSSQLVNLMLALNVCFVLGMVVSFQPLSSFAQRGQDAGAPWMSYQQAKQVSEELLNNESKGLQEWVMLFAADPEPTRYEGMPIKVSGFYHVGDDGVAMVGRHTINCCAADAMVVGVKLKNPLSYNENTWIEVEGMLGVGEAEGVRFPVIVVDSHFLTEIPDEPYVVSY